MIFIYPLALALPTSYFGGLCRYGSDYRDHFKTITSTNPHECQQNCIDITGCVAFSYTSDAIENCNLYRGGPYTYGSGKPDTTCYIIQGKFSFTLYPSHGK